MIPLSIWNNVSLMRIAGFPPKSGCWIVIVLYKTEFEHITKFINECKYCNIAGISFIDIPKNTTEDVFIEQYSYLHDIRIFDLASLSACRGVEVVFFQDIYHEGFLAKAGYLLHNAGIDNFYIANLPYAQNPHIKFYPDYLERHWDELCHLYTLI